MYAGDMIALQKLFFTSSFAYWLLVYFLLCDVAHETLATQRTQNMK